MIRFLLFLGLAVTFSAARPAPAEPKLEMGRSDTSSLYDDSRTKKIKEIINKFTPEQKKQIDDGAAIMFDRNLSVDEKYNKLTALSENKEMDADKEKMLKEFIGKLNEILHYYDKELLPGVSPKVRKVLEAMEDMIKKPTTLMEKSKEEQQAQMLKYFEGMGVDDALQIQTVMLKLMVIAITTVHGGPTVEQATINVKRVVKANNRLDVPVYKGANDSLVGRHPIVIDDRLFGFDGLGAVHDTKPKPESKYANGDSDEHAVDAILRLTKQKSSYFLGELENFREISDLTIICIGPLTNIALALKKDSEFAKRPAKLVIMGGNYLGMGNVMQPLTAEWNFHCDPEAASLVLQSMRCPVRILPWEASFFRNQYPSINYETHLHHDTSISNFLHSITGAIRKFYSSHGFQYAYCDEAAVGLVFDEIAKKMVLLRGNVELNGTFTRGQLAIDWLNTKWDDRVKSYVAAEIENPPRPFEFVVQIDTELLDKWMNRATGGKTKNLKPTVKKLDHLSIEEVPNCA